MKSIKYPVTYLIIIICILVFLFVNYLPLLTPIENAILFGAYYKAFISVGELWRVFTCGFIHIDFFHLLMNMFSLYHLGRFMENNFSKVKYLSILFFSIIGGSLFQFILKGNGLAVGISGGLYGLLAAYTYLVIRMKVYKNPLIRLNLIQTFMINLYINFIPGVAYSAHLGGFVFGLMMMGILDKHNQPSLKRNYFFATIILFLLTIYFSYQNRFIRKDELYLKTDYQVLKQEYDLGLKDYAISMAHRLDNLYNIDDIKLEILMKELP
ncbi:MAG: rhomboid family intramembrane serine protease [Solobacterium sp.]|nr:rhomboid family intramembrane serine protease [Solobacterium sp.]